MNNFYQEFKENINREALIRGTSQEEVFFSHVKDLLIDANEINEAINCHFERPTSGSKLGIQIDGYGGNPIDSQNTLTIFLVDFSFSDEIEIINKNELIRTLKKGANFINQIESSNFRNSLEESSEEFRITDQLYRQLDSISRYEIYLLTNKEERTRIKEHDVTARGELCRISVIDIKKIKELEEGKDIQEDTIMDKLAIPVLTADFDNEDYRSYLAVLDGDFLAKIYEEYGHRLLEKNVRVFLGTSRKINAGIQKSILNEPERFFAYNNGITATADDIKVEDLPRGRAITQIKNLQIVNGGQTTASIYSAYKNKKDVSKVFVQMKLSVVNKEKSEEVVPLISRYANSQNKINAADFSSNHPFHLQIEKLSRGILAPPAENSIKSTKWFYERSRGQYQDMKNKGFTISQKKRFESENPTRQKITKTDLAKFQNIWKYKPALVCRGVQKNFVEFSEGIDDEWKKNSSKYDDIYFKELVAKAIMFKTLDKLVLSKKDSWYRGYKSAIVPYTLSLLAWEIKKYKKHFNFSKVWAEQSINDDLQLELIRVAEDVNKILNDPPVNMPGNILEFAKREGCWEIIKSNKYQWSKKIDQYLISDEEFKKKKKSQKFKPIVQKKIDFEILIGSSQGSFWQKLETWINSRSDFELSDSETILLRKALGMQKTFVPNFGQSTRLNIIYERAIKQGFSGRL